MGLGKDKLWKIQYGSDKHKKILNMLKRHIDESRGLMRNRIPIWRDADALMQAHVPTADVDLAVKYSKKKDDGKIHAVDILFPYSYVAVEVLLAQLVNLMYSRKPLFGYHHFHTEHQAATKLMERIIQQQVEQSGLFLDLTTSVRDSLKYDFGAMLGSWEIRLNSRNNVQYQGTSTKSIDPYLSIVDFEAVSNQQTPAYFGFYHKIRLLDLWRDNKLYNLKHVKELMDKGQGLTIGPPYQRKSPQSYYKNKDSTVTPFLAKGTNLESTKQLWQIHIVADFIPSMEGLGSSTKPERYYFIIVRDVIVYAQKMDVNEEFPAFIFNPITDGHRVLGQSYTSLISGQQFVMNTLMHTHIFNLINAVEQILIYDPWVINKTYLEAPGPKKIPTIKPMQGKPLHNSIFQVPISDITARNMQEAMTVKGFADMITGTNTMGGFIRSSGPERLTGQEYSGQQQGTMQRINLIYLNIIYQVLKPLAEFFAENLINKLDRTIPVAVGDEIDLDLLVNKEVLDIDYRVAINLPNTAPDKIEMVYKDLFQMLAQNPGLSQHFNIVEVFKHLLITFGAEEHNLSRFIITPKAITDEDLQENPAAMSLENAAAARMQEGG